MLIVLYEDRIGATFCVRYPSYFSFSIFRILGTMDFAVDSNLAVGLSVGLVSSLRVGVRDFFYEPTHALMTSPSNVGASFVKGSLSLLTNTADGMLGIATRTTRVTGKIQYSTVEYRVQ